MRSFFSRPLMLAAALALALSASFILLAKERRATPPSAKGGAENQLLVIHGVQIHRNPPQSKLDELGVSTWPNSDRWRSGPSKFPWTFKKTETMYLLEGRVIVQVEGREGSFEIGGGDLALFPKGMKIVWDVVEAVNKHYSLLEEEEEEKAQSS